jgi:hypothetical protein
MLRRAAAVFQRQFTVSALPVRRYLTVAAECATAMQVDAR